MADIKKEAPKAPEQNLAMVFFPITAIVILLIVGSYISGVTIFGEKIENPQSNFATGKKVFNLYEWIGRGPVAEDIIIINTKKVIVRNAPAGGILGTQDKLKTGIVRVGPADAFDTTWWRIDYVDAPDGWVDASSISSKTGIVKSINIVPIVYGFYKPIGYVLLIILLILYIYYKLSLKKEEQIADRKKQLRDEQYREPAVPLSVQIEQKPDVQEIPGFQTEEIMPIEELEKQNRWIHIQDLIKSYNANDWRQAIIEADIILEEMLEKMGYDGVTIGDKLKVIERSDFITLDKAWNAHKVRNQIAHDGSNFKLTREIAEKTIKDFEEVFREFYYI